MDSCDPQTLTPRERDDILLVRTVTRDVDARTSYLLVSKYNIGLFLNWGAGLIIGHWNAPLGIGIILAGPFAVGLGFATWAAAKRRRASAEFKKLGAWDRQAINHALAQAADDKVTL